LAELASFFFCLQVQTILFLQGLSFYHILCTNKGFLVLLYLLTRVNTWIRFVIDDGHYRSSHLSLWSDRQVLAILLHKDKLLVRLRANRTRRIQHLSLEILFSRLQSTHDQRHIFSLHGSLSSCSIFLKALCWFAPHLSCKR
jgi:hypothetical protein